MIIEEIDEMDRKRHFEELRRIFCAGIDAVEPAGAIRRNIQREGNAIKVGGESYCLDEYERIYLVGAGKAGAPMAKAMEEVLGEDLSHGIIIVKHGYVCRLDRVEVVEAGHPIPDTSGLTGTQRIQDLLRGSKEKDLVFCLISGGGSALLTSPVQGISLEEKREVTRQLLSCGATISEINAIRKHLSTIKGGQLARLCYPATVVSLILSDVIGDPLDVIASGPTVPDRSTFRESAAIVERYGLAGRMPSSVTRHLRKGLNGEVKETPKQGDPIFNRVRNFTIANNLLAMEAAQRKAHELGYRTLILSSRIEGETREVALVHSGIYKEVLYSGYPVNPPACILSGGETTVTLRGSGLGGRNQEFSLALALHIQGEERVFFLSAGTDGSDGPTDAAGAFVDGATIKRGVEMGMDATAYLADNDSHHFFGRLGDLFMTGPTNTNVMDLRICLIE